VSGHLQEIVFLCNTLLLPISNANAFYSQENVQLFVVNLFAFIFCLNLYSCSNSLNFATNIDSFSEAFTIVRSRTRQVLGHKEGLNVMEKADPLFLLIGLPMIPVSLVLSKMLRWEDFILRLWRKHSSKLPFINYLFPAGQYGMHSFLSVT